MKDHIKGLLDGCERCPNCLLQPQMKFNTDLSNPDHVLIECEMHGHLACGDSVPQAIEHWNTYVKYVTKRLMGFASR